MSNLFKVILTLVLIAVALYVPWWAYVAVLVVVQISTPYRYLGLLFALYYDQLYLSNEGLVGSFPVTLSILVAFIILETFLRHTLRLPEKVNA